jgi:hypothetical protein
MGRPFGILRKEPFLRADAVDHLIESFSTVRAVTSTVESRQEGDIRRAYIHRTAMPVAIVPL